MAEANGPRPHNIDLTFAEAGRSVTNHHRAPQGHRFIIGVFDDTGLVLGVA
jgi:hypothetical protein